MFLADVVTWLIAYAIDFNIRYKYEHVCIGSCQNCLENVTTIIKLNALFWIFLTPRGKFLEKESSLFF